jgi:hypothetical protein
LPDSYEKLGRSMKKSRVLTPNFESLGKSRIRTSLLMSVNFNSGVYGTLAGVTKENEIV